MSETLYMIVDRRNASLNLRPDPGQASTSTEIGTLLKNNKDALNNLSAKRLKDFFNVDLTLGQTVTDAKIDTFITQNFSTIFHF